MRIYVAAKKNVNAESHFLDDMADDLDRKDKLASGKKKFKQFQQRSCKGLKKKDELFTDNSRGNLNQPSEKSYGKEQQVPLCENSLQEHEQLKKTSSSTVEINRSATNKESSLCDQIIFSDLNKKSKSDLHLQTNKELSSSESLRQISLQVNGLMLETDALISKSSEVSKDRSLEKRNQELARMISTLKQSNDQLQFQLQEQKVKVKHLVTNFDQQKEQLLEKCHKEQVSLKDQLQVHIQTIGILVAEKTELQSSLALSQQTAKQKAGEVEELQGRLRASRQRASDLERELIGLKNSLQQLEKISNDSKLKEQLSDQEQKIIDLEITISNLKEQQVDNSHLLETMQSDKVAASRAVKQNLELKNQLKELQEAFVSLSNDKLELAEKLHAEQLITKTLETNIKKQEEDIHVLQKQLSSKETELQNLQKCNKKGIYQQKQIADRMHHFEAQVQLIELLQKELHKSQEHIRELASQNSELSKIVNHPVEVPADKWLEKEDRVSEKHSNLVSSLSASVQQLEMERNHLLGQLADQKADQSNLQMKMKKKESQLQSEINGVGDSVSQDEYNMMKEAMQQLEVRFKQTMNRIAELSDERQELEHLVMQLQGETDTIGDYIALYQIQRGVMRKRASEKDEYISQLARDRENMKIKLVELQSLVNRLLEERKQFQFCIKDDLTPLDISSTSVHFSHGENSFYDNKLHEIYEHEETAKKIMDLFTEIESNNLMEKPVLDNFHPCPVCSGRLIII